MSDTSSIFDAYGTDLQAEEAGVWIDLRQGVRVKVRSENSVKARAWAQARVLKQRSLYLGSGGLPPEISDKNEVDLCAEVLVVDWANIFDQHKAPIPCTQANVRMLLTQLPALRRDIVTFSRIDATFKPETELAGKDSGMSSPSNSAPADASPTS